MAVFYKSNKRARRVSERWNPQWQVVQRCLRSALCLAMTALVTAKNSTTLPQTSLGEDSEGESDEEGSNASDADVGSNDPGCGVKTEVAEGDESSQHIDEEVNDNTSTGPHSPSKRRPNISTMHCFQALSPIHQSPRLLLLSPLMCSTTKSQSTVHVPISIFLCDSLADRSTLDTSDEALTAWEGQHWEEVLLSSSSTRTQLLNGALAVEEVHAEIAERSRLQHAYKSSSGGGSDTVESFLTMSTWPDLAYLLRGDNKSTAADHRSTFVAPTGLSFQVPDPSSLPPLSSLAQIRLASSLLHTTPAYLTTVKIPPYSSPFTRTFYASTSRGRRQIREQTDSLPIQASPALQRMRFCDQLLQRTRSIRQLAHHPFPVSTPQPLPSTQLAEAQSSHSLPMDLVDVTLREQGKEEDAMTRTDDDTEDDKEDDKEDESIDSEDGDQPLTTSHDSEVDMHAVASSSAPANEFEEAEAETKKAVQREDVVPTDPTANTLVDKDAIDADEQVEERLYERYLHATALTAPAPISSEDSNYFQTDSSDTTLKLNPFVSSAASHVASQQPQTSKDAGPSATAERFIDVVYIAHHVLPIVEPPVPSASCSSSPDRSPSTEPVHRAMNHDSPIQVQTMSLTNWMHSVADAQQRAEREEAKRQQRIRQQEALERKRQLQLEQRRQKQQQVQQLRAAKKEKAVAEAVHVHVYVHDPAATIEKEDEHREGDLQKHSKAISTETILDLACRDDYFVESAVSLEAAAAVQGSSSGRARGMRTRGKSNTQKTIASEDDMIPAEDESSHRKPPRKRAVTAEVESVRIAQEMQRQQLDSFQLDLTKVKFWLPSTFLRSCMSGDMDGS